MAKWGFPYKGSKNKIAQEIVDQLPEANCLVDLFAGGGAITHCANHSGKWKTIISNDIENTPEFFMDCVNGKYKNAYDHWVSREEFNKKKDNDHLIKWCWSFGNNGRDYSYGKDRENLAEHSFKAVTSKSLAERYTNLKLVLRI